MAAAKNTIKASTEFSSQDRIQQLAEDDPSVTVYKYVTDIATETIPDEDKLYTYRAILAAFDAATHAYPNQSEEMYRERIMAASSKARTFQKLFAKTFAEVTVHVTNAEEEARLDRVRKTIMLFLLERVSGEGGEDEVSARVMHHAMRLSMRDTTDEDRATGTVLPPAQVNSLPKVTPLNPTELGPSSVRQLYRTF